MSDPKEFDTYPKAETGLATCSGDPTQDEKVSSKIKRRVHEKMDDYESYRFSAAQSTALNIFFDLVQEFEGEHEFYSVIVTVPKVLFNLESNLYLLTEEKKLDLVCYTKEDIPHDDLFEDDEPAEGPVKRGKYYVLPIRANKALIEQLPFSPPDGIIGYYVVYPADDMSDRELLFWEKYANRIGFQLHNRIINAKNREHLEFIRSLVRDIGHNVIVPNMYFRLFFNRLRGRIEGIKQLRDDLDSLAANYAINDPAFRNLGAKIDYFHDALKKQYNEIFRHYEQTSLFLETLLRQRHFEEGRYVLEKRRCNLKKRVIEPQLERYRSRLEERDIRIDMSMGGVPDKEICLVADIGLISQVYANLFSNAVKYAREVELNGKRDKYLAFGWEYIEDYFGPDKPGIKFNVFTTGPHLSQEDAAGLYESGFRGRNISGEYGTGHGLSFVKEIVELHDGEVGYEQRPHGNNFFFVLPADPEHIKNCL
jgi:signal transduction histidine kinase